MSYTRPAYDAADASWEGAATYTRPAYNEADASWEESTPAITADAVIAIARAGGIAANIAASTERVTAINASSALLLDLDGQPQDIQATLFAQIERSRSDAKSQVLLLDSWSPVSGEATNAISLEFLQGISQAEQLTISRDSPIAKDAAFSIESLISATFSLELPIRFEELIGAPVTVLVERSSAIVAPNSIGIAFTESYAASANLLLEQLLGAQLLAVILAENSAGISAPAGLLLETQSQLFSENTFAIALFGEQAKTNVFALEALTDQLSALALISTEQLYGDGVSVPFPLERFANVNVTHAFWLDVDTRNAAVLCSELQKLGISHELAVQLAETALTTGMVLVELSASTMSSELQHGSVERLLRHNTLTVH